MPDFDPLHPLMSFLLGYDSDVVRDVLYRTGVPEDGKLMAELPEVRELFFPPGSQYDAYSGIKSIIDLAQDSIMVVDNYVDPTLFTMLAMLDKKNVQTQVLTHNTGQNAAAQEDFNLAAKKFTQQYPNLPITIRLSADFRDRFLILDGQRRFHIGASIKDAGKKAFLISEVEDPNNRTALMTQATQTWTAANAYIISAG